MSPYLRSHAGNPVDWWPWGEEAFAEAGRRDVPVMVSIGYATCHWCHVMARESFSDPEVAAVPQRATSSRSRSTARSIAEVDAAYLAAASAFTQNLGWPLTVFATPQGRAFFAGTYWPPVEAARASGVPRGARRGARRVARSGATCGRTRRPRSSRPRSRMPQAAARGVDLDLAAVVAALEAEEDREFGGFGAAPARSARSSR